MANPRNAFAAYRQNRLHGIQDASPATLIGMMLDEAIACANTAAAACDNGNIPARGEAISKALAIIDAGLLDALDMEKGGEIAANLSSLYNFCLRSLMSANIASDPTAMRHCANLLMSVREGWRAAEALERG